MDHIANFWDPSTEGALVERQSLLFKVYSLMYSYTVLDSWNCIFFSLVLWWASASCLFKAWSVQRWGSEILLVHKPKEVRMHSSSLCTYLFSTFLLSACQTEQSRIQLHHLIWLYSSCKGVCAITAAVSEGQYIMKTCYLWISPLRVSEAGKYLLVFFWRQPEDPRGGRMCFREAFVSVFQNLQPLWTPPGQKGPFSTDSA